MPTTTLRRPSGAHGETRAAPASGATWAAVHAPTHLHHLPVVNASRNPGRCPAVVVPTSRDPLASPTRGFAHAARLAADHQADLVVVVSQAAATGQARAEIERRVAAATGGAVQPEIVDLGRPALDLATAGCRLPTLAAHTLGLAGEVPVSDVPAKRNAALELAVRRGWRALLFLDDDIRPWGEASEQHATLDPVSLRTAVGALADEPAARRRAVGWPAEKHADNSVVCRIRRRANLHQGVFVGAGALLVAVDELTPFFPAVYNEDWLFVIAQLRLGRRAVGRAGRVRQDAPAHAPTPVRAVYEEFGDVLAEALMNLALAPGPLFASANDPVFWQEVLRRRARMVRDLRRDLVAQDRRAGSSSGWELPVLDVLDQLYADAPKDLAEAFPEYVSAWRGDLRAWRRHLTSRGAPLAVPART
jgi:hypothetical protein